VKSLNEIEVLELAIFRFFSIFVGSLPICLYHKQTIFPDGKRILLIMRSLTGCFGLILSFYAFRHMPLSDASAIIFSMPVFVAIFARVFLKEPCGLFHLVTIILTLIGVVLIAKPSVLFGNDTISSSNKGSLFEDENKSYGIYGPLAAISSTIFSANVIILLRALRSVHYSVIMVNFGFFSTLFTFFVIFYSNGFCMPPCQDRFLILLIALFSFGGQILLTLSLNLEDSGPVSLARSSDIVFAFIWQIMFFNDPFNFFSLLGSFLVCTSVIINGMRKYIMSLPRDSETRKRFYLIAIE
jgi:drug/metabolite transporter (DMT)-like permease